MGGDRPFLKTAQMETEHEKEKRRAVVSYLEKNKYGRKNQRVVEKYQTQLEEVGTAPSTIIEIFQCIYFHYLYISSMRDPLLRITVKEAILYFVFTLSQEIDKSFGKFLEQNEAKNVFKAARTPATLFSALMMFYLLSGIFGVFGIYPIASICNLGMGAFLIMLSLWAYVR